MTLTISGFPRGVGSTYASAELGFAQATSALVIPMGVFRITHATVHEETP